MGDNKKIAEHMLKELESPSKPLSDWEENFLDDMRSKLEEWGSLTERQFDKLESIYAEKTA